MNINTLLDRMATAIATDQATIAWCDTTYSKAHRVYVNIDSRNPPGEAECPFVVLYPTSKSVGNAVSKKRHGFEVDCCICDESTRSAGQVLEYNAVRRIEEFRKLIESALSTVEIGDGLMETVETEYDVIESFPFAWAGMQIEISEYFYTGSDPLE